jgi:hypothetical protein
MAEIIILAKRRKARQERRATNVTAEKRDRDDESMLATDDADARGRSLAIAALMSCSKFSGGLWP